MSQIQLTPIIGVFAYHHFELFIGYLIRIAWPWILVESEKNMDTVIDLTLSIRNFGNHFLHKKSSNNIQVKMTDISSSYICNGVLIYQVLRQFFNNHVHIRISIQTVRKSKALANNTSLICHLWSRANTLTWIFVINNNDPLMFTCSLNKWPFGRKKKHLQSSYFHTQNQILPAFHLQTSCPPPFFYYLQFQIF